MRRRPRCLRRRRGIRQNRLDVGRRRRIRGDRDIDLRGDDLNRRGLIQVHRRQRQRGQGVSMFVGLDDLDLQECRGRTRVAFFETESLS
jgi:hypothetical protein